jgi:hypothetical protein
MQKRLALAAALVGMGLILGVSTPVAAQTPPNVESGRAETAPGGSIDVDRLPVDLGRIRRELKQSPDGSETREGLRLRYFLQIYGTAPTLQLFTEADNLVSGPVPYGAPTHQEILNVITPQEFRTPVMDFGNLFRVLSEKLSKKKN